MFPEASLLSWMPAIPAGMTMICIFMLCGRAKDHESLSDMVHTNPEHLF
jgi:hypothetical protein